MKRDRNAETRRKILNAGLKLWPNVTQQAIADRIGITRQAVSLHFKQGMLKDAIAEHAVKMNNSRVIVQLIAVGHPLVADLSPSDRARHFKAVSG